MGHPDLSALGYQFGRIEADRTDRGRKRFGIERQAKQKKQHG